MEMLTPIPFVLSTGHLLKGGKRALAGFCAGLMATTIFTLRVARRNDRFHFSSRAIWRLGSGKEMKSSHSLGIQGNVRLYPGLAFFPGPGTSLEPTRRLGHRHPAGYYQG